MKKTIAAVFAFCLCAVAFAQDEPSDALEAHLQQHFSAAKNAPTSADALAASDSIRAVMQLALAEKNSFFRPFSALPHLGKIYSDDKMLRIYTWNVPLADGTFAYGGFVQKSSGEIFPLTLADGKAYRPDEKKTIPAGQWYGALYYQAINVKLKKANYYLLLGWKGNDDLTQMKIIETLQFDKSGQPVFGVQVLHNELKQSVMRQIFEYGAQFGMTLSHQKRSGLVIFDHLSPSSPRFKGILAEYGPDFSYDAYELKKGKWIFKPDIDARNEE